MCETFQEPLWLGYFRLVLASLAYLWQQVFLEILNIYCPGQARLLLATLGYLWQPSFLGILDI